MSQKLSGRQGVLAFVVIAILLYASLAMLLGVGGGGSGQSGAPDGDGEDLPVDQAGLWQWTQAATDRSVDRTPSVEVRQLGDFGDRRASRLNRFQRLLLRSDPSGESTPISAVASRQGYSVLVNDDWLPEEWNATSTRRVASTLVHEYVHLLQYETDVYVDAGRSLAGTVDGQRTFVALSEGAAAFVAGTYDGDSPIDDYRAVWDDPETPSAERYSLWPYYRGTQYVADRIDEPAEIWSLYNEPPRTTAAILRRSTATAPPPEREVAAPHPSYDADGADRFGAMFVEVALTTVLDPDRARAVATGWRWDAYRSIDRAQSGDRFRTTQLWLTEWRDPAAADAFHDAMRTYLDGRWSPVEGRDRWSIDDARSVDLLHVDGEAVGVLVGPPTFLEDVTVRSTNDGYAVVSPASSDGRSDPAPALPETTGLVVGAPSASSAPAGAAGPPGPYGSSSGAAVGP